MSGELVLVTGGSGFLGSQCVLQLLAQGYRVRTTVRSLAREAEVRAMLTTAGARADAPLTFFAAELGSDAGWAEAVAGCDFVLHVASPFPPSQPKDENELIIPARDGALRVLRAARDAGVKRVVLTSSFAAIGYGHPHSERPFTEQTWTDLSAPGLSPYVKSKTLAEKAAWDFVAREGGALELTVINPTGIFGPVLSTDLASSVAFVKRLLDGALPGLPDVAFGVVDVRDVAELHLRAMIDPAAKGERFLAVAGDLMRFAEVAALLKARLGPAGAKIPTRALPSGLLKVAALVVPPLRQLVPDLGKRRRGSNEKARRVLGWKPRANEEALLATAESLVRLSFP